MYLLMVVWVLFIISMHLTIRYTPPVSLMYKIISCMYNDYRVSTFRLPKLSQQESVCFKPALHVIPHY